MCGPSSFVSNFNFCFLGVIPKPFPKEQLPKSSLAYLTLALEAGNDIPASGHLHLMALVSLLHFHVFLLPASPGSLWCCAELEEMLRDLCG